MKKLFLLAWLMLLSACMHVSNEYSVSNWARAVNVCANHHANSQVGTYSIADAENLSYFIVFAEHEERIYCHIDKGTGDLVYANGNNLLLNDALDSTAYRERYADIAEGKKTFGKMRIESYKFIAGKWRYIYTRKSDS